MATCTQSVQHWHVWRVALTGRGAFISRAYLVRSTAKKAAATWSGRTRRRDVAFVRECMAGPDCPRPPRRGQPVAAVVEVLGGIPGAVPRQGAAPTP